MMSKTS